MLIHWLIPGNYKHTEDISNSNLASSRMRAGLVGKFANDIQIEFSAGDQINLRADAIVVGKIGADCQNGRGELWTNQLAEAKQRSKKIILDYTDHHLAQSSSSMGNFYREILPLVDHAVVSSAFLSQLLSSFFNQSVTIIEDPIEIPTIRPNSSIPTDRATLLWFGHATNIGYLLRYLENSLLFDVSVKLIILSNAPGLSMVESRKHRLREKIDFNLIDWSILNMLEAASASHACLIPSDVNDEKKSGASSNRLLTSFALGLPVAADTLHSYAPFSAYFHDIRTGPLSIFISQLASYKTRVKLAQDLVLPNFTQETLARKWKGFFHSTIKA